MKPSIVMQTDFGYGISTSVMEGVCMMVDPDLRIFHNTHSIPNFDTYQASVSLAYAIDYWAPGTIFISVVDPGVGTSRRGVVAKLKNGSYVVGPDNGSLTHMTLYPGIESVREIDESRHRLPGSEDVLIFHGRDVFAYTAAKLAAGLINFEDVGTEYSVDEIITHAITEPQVKGNEIWGMIESADFHFGLISTNIPIDVFKQEGIHYGDICHVLIAHDGKTVFAEDVPYVPSFGSVPVGEPLLMNSEMKTIQIAINERNMTEEYGIRCGSGWTMAIARKTEEEL